MKQVEIGSKKLLQKLQLTLAKDSRKREKPVLKQGARIIVVRLNRVGDALVTTPLLQVLKESLDAHITVLADKRNHFVFDTSPFVDEVMVYDKSLGGQKKTARLLNEGHYDAVIDAHVDTSFTVSRIIAKSKIPVKICLEKETEKFYTTVVPLKDPRTTHIVDRLLGIPEYFGLSFDPEQINLSYPLEETIVQKAKAFIQKRYPNKKLLIAINISAGSSARFWGVENFKALISLIKEMGADYILLGISHDIRNAMMIEPDMSKVALPDFDLLTAYIAEADILFTPDTSAVHLASISRTPVFGLYVHYNTTDIPWFPYRSDFDHVLTRAPGLTEISFESVKEPFTKFIKKYMPV